MIEETAKRTLRQQQADSDVQCDAPVTIFALPKPFVGESARHQGNAIRSWLQLQPAVDVMLFGDEEGIADFAAKHEVAHIGPIDRNESGTPLVNHAFSMAHQHSTSPVLVYCNADVILDEGFTKAVEQLANQQDFERWLAIGQRTDVQIDRDLNFSKPSDGDWLRQQSATHGQKSSHVCKEYFVFSRDLFNEIPPFAVGRGNWDNWMVASVKPDGVPVIDLSRMVSAIHQSHDYRHAKTSRMKCYVSGEEARENQRLAGGRNLISGATCTHRLGDNGIKPIPMTGAVVDFLLDVPRFAKLLTQLLLGR